MKLSFALIILLSAGFLVHGQDSTHTRKRIRYDKFAAGDIGLRYQLAYNGSLQSQFTVSGFVSKRVEVGGTFALNFNHISATYQGTQIPPNDSVAVAYQTFNNGWGYKLGFSPFVIGHFSLKGKCDLYLGGLAMFQICNTGTNSFTFFNPPGFNYETYGNGTQNPVEYTLGAGYVLGCQYFFTRHFSLGIQISEWIGYAFAKPNALYSQTNPTNTPPYYMKSTAPLNFVANADEGAYAGITLSYYFSAKKKNHHVTG